jgi:hypothetical protein
MSLAKHAAFLVVFLVLSGHAQAQSKGVPVVAPADAPETTGAISTTAPAAMILGCPDGPACPPEPEGLGDADKEVLKEFAKCAAEEKSLDTCLSSDPPPALSQLTEEDRARLVQCLGSSDLSSTKERWSGCLVGAD